MTTGRQADTWSIGNILYYMANFEYPFGDPADKAKYTENVVK